MWELAKKNEGSPISTLWQTDRPTDGLGDNFFSNNCLRSIVLIESDAAKMKE